MIKKYLLLTITAFLLTACGGSSGKPLFGGGDDSDNAGGGMAAALSTNTFYPLNLYYSGEGYVEDGDAMDFFTFDPSTQAYLISPVDARTLESAKNPKLSDYVLNINGEETPEMDEYLPVFQKVEGLPVQLHTALIIDASASSRAIEKTALINEVKKFVADAKASSNPVISEQLFSLWVFGGRVEPLLTEFTNDKTEIDAALDGINFYDYESNSAVYQSIVAAVGYYEGPGSNELTQELNYKFLDPKTQNTPSQVMLLDGYERNGQELVKLNLSNVILFASGGNSSAYFNKEAALTALNWQSFLVFDKEAEVGNGFGDFDPNDTESSNDPSEPSGFEALDGMKHAGKPLYYVSLGENKVSDKIKSLAKLTIDTNSENSFSFSKQLIDKQSIDVAERSRLNNMYMLRFPIFERDGKTSSSLLSRTNYRDYFLSFELEFGSDQTGIIPEPTPLLEITGPSNEFLAGGKVSASKYSKLYPAVRWDSYQLNQNIAAFDWTVDGVSRTADTDGSISITAADVGKTVVLSNGALPPATIVIK